MPPVLAESICLASLPGVAVPVRAVLTLDERRIEGPTCTRLSQRRCHCGYRAENRPSGDLYHPPFLACLLHHGVGEALRRDFVGSLGTTTFAGPRWRDGLPVGVENRFLVGRIAVGGDQVHQPAPSATLEVLHHRRDVLPSPFAGNHADDQPALGVDRNVVPGVSFAVVGWVIGITVLLFL